MPQDCRSRSYTNRTPQSNEYCSNCRRPGHMTQDCRSQANRDFRNQSYTNRVSQPNTYCDYCRRPGHTIQECRSQAYANISCEYCKFRGHTIEQCRKKMYFDKKEKEEAQSRMVRRQAILRLKTEQIRKSPSILLSDIRFSGGQTTLMIDTGSDLNVIKRCSVFSRHSNFHGHSLRPQWHYGWITQHYRIYQNRNFKYRKLSSTS